MAKYTGLFGRSIYGPFGFNVASLFKDGQQGFWYDPSKINTLFQDSSGSTAVTADGEPVGLVLDNSQGLELGPEEVVNGDFATDTVWTKSGFATIDNGVLRIVTGGSASGAFQNITNIGSLYKITVDVVVRSGACKVQLGSDATNSFIITSSGSYTFTVRNEGADGNFFLVRNNACDADFDNVSVKEIKGNHGTQTISASRPTYKELPSRLDLDLVDDSIILDVPVGGWVGSMVLATDDGTATYGITLPAGDYEIGGDFFPGSSINNVLIRNGAITAEQSTQTEAAFVESGAKASYGDVTDFTSYWREMNELTNFPLIDTSSGIVFNAAWYKCLSLTSFPLIDTSSGNNLSSAWRNCPSLTSFPLIDTSSGTDFTASWRDCTGLTSFPLIDTSRGTNFTQSWRSCSNLTSFPLVDVAGGTNFQGGWQGCSSLTSFPTNFFDNCVAINFASCFTGTNLSQASIDGILVSINSNGTSNGTFDQSGGTAPSATGESAITSLRGRGWTVTVTGGF